MKKPILHLNLKKKWFDMILLGSKKEEYREMSEYWMHRFNSMFFTLGQGHPIKIIIKNVRYDPTDVIICFSNGYRKDRRQFKIECKDLTAGKGRTEWGAEKNVNYFILKLGAIL